MSGPEEKTNKEEQSDQKYDKINLILIGVILVMLITFLGLQYIETKAEKRIELVSIALSATEETTTETPQTDNSELLVNINTADKEELMKLQGIGEKKAEAIVQYRYTFGDFLSIEDIMEVDGIGEKIFENIKDNITV